MGLFNVNYNNLVWQCLPVRLRQSIHYAWLKCLVAPVVYLYDLFTANRSNNIYTLAHNSQVCYMEAVLNDTFDNSDRGIFISEHLYYDPLYIYEVLESKPVFIDKVSEIGTGVIPSPDPVPLYLGGETLFIIPDFIINVPAAIDFDTIRMRAIVDLYRLAGKSAYLILSY